MEMLDEFQALEVLAGTEELLEEATTDDETDEMIGALDELEDDTAVGPDDEVVELTEYGAELLETGEGETYTVERDTVVELAEEDLEELETTGFSV
jgi:hypothetical protein